MRWLASSPMILCWDCFLGKPREHGVDKALDFQKTLGENSTLFGDWAASRHAIGFSLSSPST